MKDQVIVVIVGAPIACADGIKDSWREVAAWVGRQLEAQFGKLVRVGYYDLFDLKCPTLPENAQLPVVMVNGNLVSSGGKVSLPLIKDKIKQLK